MTCTNRRKIGRFDAVFRFYTDHHVVTILYEGMGDHLRAVSIAEYYLIPNGLR